MLIDRTRFLDGKSIFDSGRRLGLVTHTPLKYQAADKSQWNFEFSLTIIRLIINHSGQVHRSRKYIISIL